MIRVRFVAVGLSTTTGAVRATIFFGQIELDIRMKIGLVLLWRAGRIDPTSLVVKERVTYG
jgi:hypothetical protein